MNKVRQKHVLEGIAVWAGYYRCNPHRFARDYLHLDLRLFQKILLFMMNQNSIFVFIACRGIGKTFLSAVFCTIRCILYPGTRIVIASGTRGQSAQVLGKISLELVSKSPELKNEIDYKSTSLNGQNPKIVFKNGSIIEVKTAGDSARGSRANILLLDEFRMIKKDAVDTILRKFLTQRRMPSYSALAKEERNAEYSKEKNKTLYLSSAYYADSWAYAKTTDTFRLMLQDNNHNFVCGFPYQLAIEEGIVDASVIEDEIVESGFNEIKFSMEYGAIFWGGTDGAFFDFSTVSKNRHINYPMLPDRLANKIGNNTNVRIPTKINGEKRILSADIALMASKKHNNDATAIFINQLLPTKSGRYSSNIVYCDVAEGLHTEDQALMIRRLYEEYACDYIVIDAAGVGLGCYDALVRDIPDPDTGEIYPALSCCNDPDMAARCTVSGAEKVIWSIKASAALNSECAVLLREGFRSGRIRLLLTEVDGEALLNELKGYKNLNPQEKLAMQMPYIHTTLLINELVNLLHDESNGKVRVYEKSGMRKDRYSSLGYNYYVATILENKLRRRSANTGDFNDIFMIKPPKNTITGKRRGWR